tara:strand:- start:4368 stop:6203 length:1836 start_codon:yes stop_codon:yes gene_type:complete
MIVSDRIKNKLNKLPRKPGVYLFKDKDEKTIYIGKAKVLTKRVRSYFYKSAKHAPKVLSLLKKINDFEWIVTGSEVEALLTEANLIKEQMPRYNILLRDDKTFPYIRITNEQFPQVLITRKIIHDGSKYFGPYTDVRDLRLTLKVLHKIFPIRSCDYNLNDENINKKKYSVCLDYHINRCQGPCEGIVHTMEYQKMINNVISFLHGRTTFIRKKLKQDMQSASKKMLYEEASTYRDQLISVQNFSKRQSKASAYFDDKDFIAISYQGNDACGVVVRIRNGKIVGREKVFLVGVRDETNKRILADFIRQFYLMAYFVPPEIILPEIPEDPETLSEWLKIKREGSIKFLVPKRGEKARLLKVSLENSDLLLKEHLRKKNKRKDLVPVMVKELQEDLNLSIPPRRIEAFDISNIQESDAVGAMVCFIDGRPRKSEYRKFKIKSVKGIDDFAMMREIVFRRYSRLKDEKGKFPDLILIDGGKGQLNMAISALRELGLDYIFIVSLAKRLEEVFVPNHSEAQSISKNSPGILLLRKIRDEVHRFAISFHRQLRKKNITKSIFDELYGVGPVTKTRLLKKYLDLDAISNSSPSDIIKETGVSIKVAKSIINRAKSFK